MDALARAKERDKAWRKWYDAWKAGKASVREVAKAMDVEVKTAQRKLDIWQMTE